jgi:hypothetical protein
MGFALGPPPPPPKNPKSRSRNKHIDIQMKLMDTWLNSTYFKVDNTPALSGVYTSPTIVDHKRFNTRKMTCEYCGTSANNSYEINSCPSCNAPYSFIEFLNWNSYVDLEQSLYKRCAIRVMGNCCNKIESLIKSEAEVVEILSNLTDDVIEQMVPLFLKEIIKCQQRK